MDQRHEKHHLPRAVLEQIGKILFRRAFLLVDRLDALPGGDERDEEQDKAERRPNRHRHLPAILPVMPDCELGDQGERKASHNELRRVYRDETVGVEACTFV
jgi:hypothetical protein